MQADCRSGKTLKIPECERRNLRETSKFVNIGNTMYFVFIIKVLAINTNFKQNCIYAGGQPRHLLFVIFKEIRDRSDFPPVYLFDPLQSALTKMSVSIA